MRKFICKSDIIIMGKKIASQGDTLEEGQLLKSDDEALVIKLDLNYLSGEQFEEITKFDFNVKEVDISEENIEKDWIIQLKITTSRKKLREIESFLKENLNNLI